VHFTGIVIRGKHSDRQKCSSYVKTSQLVPNDTDEGYIVIGDNVEFGANSCIIGDINIGDNVTIGAMSLINKNVPDNHTVYNSKDMILIQNAG
jgi:serine acetyltransferase